MKYRTKANLLKHLDGLTSAHGKDIVLEERLAWMNELLAPVQQNLEQELETPQTPPVFVLGPPRSGTTVMSQLLASTGLFTIATNFVARFWHAPFVGLTIQNALNLCEETKSWSFCSTRGITEGWCEPSEFGYFWSRFFDLGQTTHCLGRKERDLFDRPGLLRALASLEWVGGQPLALKNNTWFTLNADLLAEMFPQCVLVACDRDPYFVAQSIWRQRKEYFGDTSKWWSLRPGNYDEIRKLDPVSQVAAQTLAIRAEMNESLDKAKSCKIVRVDYTRLCENPRQVVGDVIRNVQLEKESALVDLSQIPSNLISTDGEGVDESIAARLGKCLTQLQGSKV